MKRYPKKPCDCGYLHYPSFCPRRQKPIKKQGKQAKEWLKIRQDWFKRHHQTTYMCYICGEAMDKSETTLDHVIPRSNARNYSKRHDDDNLKPCCYTCNTQKGSKRY